MEQIYSTSELRKNVIHWYPIEKNSSVLQIGATSVKVIEELCNKAEKVVVIVNTETEKENIEKHIKTENIKVKVEPALEELEQEKEEYDYVTLIDSIELYEGIIEKKAYKRLDTLLGLAKNKCKKDGKILITIPNKYGIKFWTTMYAQKNILCNEKFALSKKMIQKLLEKNELLHYKYYYMLPDDKITNVIFTDNYMPNIESINRNFTYGEEEFTNFNQTEAYIELLKEDKDLFPFYANSYFVEIGKESLQENHIQFVSYTNIRKEEYRIQTTIYEDRVEKTNINEKAKDHINNIKRNIDVMNEIGLNTLDSYENGKIISKYVENAKTYDKILLEYLEKEENDKFFQTIEDYKQNVLYKLGKVELKDIQDNNIFTKYGVKCPNDILAKFQFIKNGLWDLIFQNIFYVDGKLYFYDQEWYDENVPIEYILYRTIAYFGSAHAYIPSKQLYEKLGILEYIDIFQELDEKIQEKIRDEKMWNLHKSTKTGQTLLDSYNNLKEAEQTEGKQTKKTKKELMEDINTLEHEITKLKQENQQMVNSVSWRITKPIRWVRENITKQKEKK